MGKPACTSRWALDLKDPLVGCAIGVDEGKCVIYLFPTMAVSAAVEGVQGAETVSADPICPSPRSQGLLLSFLID